MGTQQKISYLTKSRFTHALDCPTRLYYACHSDIFRSTMDDNDFLKALAQGGIQVGELAKLYYPGGQEISTLNSELALEQTRELLLQENCIIYEAALSMDNCLVRVDILEKKGDFIRLIEVKSKSWDPEVSFFSSRDHTIRSNWQKYLYDIAFQFRVAQTALKDYRIEPCLLLIDKSKAATIDGLHQHFSVSEKEGRFRVEVKEGTTAEDLGEPVLTTMPVFEAVDLILQGKARIPQSEAEAKGFDAWITELQRLLEADEASPARIGEKCKSCMYRIPPHKLKDGEQSGFERCWKEALNWKDEDFEEPHVFDIWNERNMQGKYLDHDVYKMEELIPEMLPAKVDQALSARRWDNDQRKTVQIMMQTGNIPQDAILLDGLAEDMESWVWPLHFIDFEAVLAAIPFHKGMKPYDYIPFQFSCHTVYEDGRVEHRADWIEEEPGRFPCITFVRKLKACLEGDRGTVFRYHSFENTVLNKMAGLIRERKPADAEALLAFITSLTKGGDREMVDQYRLIKEYHYSVHMGGSISIKQVLPAVLSESDFLKEKYSRPYSGLYIKDKIFYHEDPATGKAISPYKLLDPVGHGIPDDETTGDILQQEQHITEGGTAMMAWSRLQFGDMEEAHRKAVLQSLYEYCELDTLAMVMIYEGWRNR